MGMCHYKNIVDSFFPTPGPALSSSFPWFEQTNNIGENDTVYCVHFRAEKINSHKTLIRMVAIYWAESCTLNADIAKRLTAFERTVLGIIFWGIKVNANGESDIIKNYSSCFRDLDILSFVRVSRLEWIGHVNRIYSKKKVSQVLNNNPLARWLRGRPKKRWSSCVQTDV